MAEKLDDFMREQEATEPPEFTAPQIYYGEKEDSLTLYLRSDESYAHYLNDFVTIFLSFDKNELVGCQVKGLHCKLRENDGKYGVAIMKNRKVELGLFFHLLAYDMPDAEPRNRLVELGQRAKGLEVDAEELALTC